MYAPRYFDGKRVQLTDIYYNGAGILQELSPEEMEEAFQERSIADSSAGVFILSASARESACPRLHARRI